ncbi:hypothetical protein LTR37_017550 [Vermiconidia calcicola]|uniref:Uncharacterized protein n=1 Tax=Vermiconidia calcicola TaxID=1690605 RepID=A0ACC3MLC7_9PEZI|nr:hypothetical protein LTR37_017550 [Vermiconidia calcicola]
MVSAVLTRLGVTEPSLQSNKANADLRFAPPDHASNAIEVPAEIMEAQLEWFRYRIDRLPAPEELVKVVEGTKLKDEVLRDAVRSPHLPSSRKHHGLHTRLKSYAHLQTASTHIRTYTLETLFWHILRTELPSGPPRFLTPAMIHAKHRVLETLMITARHIGDEEWILQASRWELLREGKRCMMERQVMEIVEKGFLELCKWTRELALEEVGAIIEREEREKERAERVWRTGVWEEPEGLEVFEPVVFTLENGPKGKWSDGSAEGLLPDGGVAV